MVVSTWTHVVLGCNVLLVWLLGAAHVESTVEYLAIGSWNNVSNLLAATRKRTRKRKPEV